MTPTPDQVKTARQQAGLTQTQFGAMVGASHKAVQAWEAGTRNMPSSKWELINIKLGITKMSKNKTIREASSADLQRAKEFLDRKFPAGYGNISLTAALKAIARENSGKEIGALEREFANG